MGVNNLPRVATRQCTGQELNPRPIDCESNALATTLPSHPMSFVILYVFSQPGNHKAGRQSSGSCPNGFAD